MDIAFDDLNGDSYPDAFLANHGPNTVFFGTPQGTFRPSTQRLGDDQSFRVILRDFNLDGHLDAFVANFDADKVYLGSHSGTFTLSQTLPASKRAAFPYNVEVVDLNSDGIQDIRVHNFRDHHGRRHDITDYIVHPIKPWTSTIRNAPKDDTPTHAQTTHRIHRDLNNDGVPDTLTTHPHSHTLAWGSDQNNIHAGHIPHTGDPVLSTHTHDFNNDGLLDILTLQTGRHFVSFDMHHQNLGVQRERLTQTLLVQTPNQPPTCQPFALHTTLTPGPEKLPPAYANTPIPPQSRANILRAYRPLFHTISTHDINHDGLQDLVATHADGVYAWLHNTRGLFDPPVNIVPSPETEPVYHPPSLVIDDLNDDGFEDLITLHRLNDTFSPSQFNNGLWNIEGNTDPLPFAHTMLLGQPNALPHNIQDRFKPYTTPAHIRGPQYFNATFAHTLREEGKPHTTLLADTHSLYACTNITSPSRSCTHTPFSENPTLDHFEPETTDFVTIQHDHQEGHTPRLPLNTFVPITTHGLLVFLPHIETIPERGAELSPEPLGTLRQSYPAQAKPTDTVRNNMRAYNDKRDRTIMQYLVDDLNNDTHQDVLILRYTGQHTLLQANSDGSFQTPQTLQSPHAPKSQTRKVFTGDFNNDQKIDLLISYNTQVHLHLSTPTTRSFRDLLQTQPTQPHAGAQSFAVGDLNNDGNLDFIASHGYPTVHLGRGDGTFRRPSTIQTRQPSPTLFLGDLNNDNTLDLVTAHTHTDRTLSVWYGLPNAQ